MNREREKMNAEGVRESAEYIKGRISGSPVLGIIIGTGLEGILKSVEIDTQLRYSGIPGFVNTTVARHEGVLVFGRLGGVDTVIMNGRFHCYEGYTMQEVVFPVYVMKELGVTHMLVSNACGGISPELAAGSLVIITDHINLMGDNPLIGRNDDRLGPRYPDMYNTYDSEFISLIERAAGKADIPVGKGVYAAVSGPNLETPAEYRWLRTIGADVVGMSTVPEIIAGVHCGLKNGCLSVVTDECWPEALKPVNIAEIIRTASEAAKPLCRLVETIAETLGEE